MRYRWKHRVCTACAGALRLRGFVTSLGEEASRGLQTCAGVSGLIYLRGVEMPPPLEKLREVKIPEGGLQIRAICAPRLPNPGKAGWISVDKDQLELLREPSKPVRWLACVPGFIVSGAPYLISAPTNYNRAKAVMCRMYRFLEPAVPGLWPRLWLVSKGFFFPCIHSTPDEMDMEDWILSLPKCRQKPIRRALALYIENGWRRTYALFAAFLKLELLVAFEKKNGILVPLETMVDRLICAPHDVTHVIAGRKIKPYMQWLKQQWHEDHFLFYAGTKPEKAHHWLQVLVSRGPLFYFWSDFTMFDASHCDDTWDIIESLYEKYKTDVDFQRVLKAWRSPAGKIGDLRFSGRVMNASGRADTAFANAILNGLASWCCATAAYCGLTLREVELEHLLGMTSVLSLTVTGDDALGALPLCGVDSQVGFLSKYRHLFTELGLKAKVYGSERLEDAVYLAHRPLPVDGVWYWAKTIGRAFPKMGYKAEVKGDLRAHFAGICHMHIQCSPHVPILSDFAKAWLHSAGGVKHNCWQPDPNRPWQEWGRIAPPYYDRTTVQAVARAYTVDKDVCRGDLGMQNVVVTESDIMSAIDHVRSQASLAGGRPCVLDHWVLRHMVLVDEQ